MRFAGLHPRSLAISSPHRKLSPDRPLCTWRRRDPSSAVQDGNSPQSLVRSAEAGRLGSQAAGSWAAPWPPTVSGSLGQTRRVHSLRAFLLQSDNHGSEQRASFQLQPRHALSAHRPWDRMGGGANPVAGLAGTAHGQPQGTPAAGCLLSPAGASRPREGSQHDPHFPLSQLLLEAYRLHHSCPIPT